MEERDALRYHTCDILEGADSKDALAFANGASPDCNSEPSGRDKGEAPSDVSEESKLDGTKSSSDSDLEYPALHSSTW